MRKNIYWVLVMCIVVLGGTVADSVARGQVTNQRNRPRRQRSTKTGTVTTIKKIGGSTNKGLSLSEQHSRAFTGQSSSSWANASAITSARQRAKTAKTKKENGFTLKR